MQILCLGDDWQTTRVPRALGTSYPWSGQEPVRVSPLHQPTLPDLSTQCRLGNGHLYVEGTAHGCVLMTPTSRPSRQVSKTIALPLLHLGRENDLSYLNHIIIAHYNASYGCGKCLKQAFVSPSALHDHKKVCLGFITKKPAAGSDNKPSSSRVCDGSHSGSTRATPKKKDSKAPATDSQGSSTQPASQTMPHHSGRETSYHHKSHKDPKDSSGDKKKKKKEVSPARQSSSHKVCKDSHQ